eukprot:gene17769-biopygen831
MGFIATLMPPSPCVGGRVAAHAAVAVCRWAGRHAHAAVAVLAVVSVALGCGEVWRRMPPCPAQLPHPQPCAASAPPFCAAGQRHQYALSPEFRALISTSRAFVTFSPWHGSPDVGGATLHHARSAPHPRELGGRAARGAEFRPHRIYSESHESPDLPWKMGPSLHLGETATDASRTRPAQYNVKKRTLPDASSAVSP